MSHHPLVDTLNSRFAGKISSGAHAEASGAACVLEIVSAARGVPWTDSPESLGMPDFRSINDAYADDGARTLAMVRLGVAFWDYAEWPAFRRAACWRAIALATVRELLPPVLRAAGVAEALVVACAEAEDLGAAYAASSAAADAADAAAADAAADAAAAADDARTTTLDRAVDIWVRCAGASAGVGA